MVGVTSSSSSTPSVNAPVPAASSSVGPVPQQQQQQQQEPQQLSQQPTSGPSTTAAVENDLNKREKTLAEFLAMMDNYTPIIPDAVTDYYLSRTGFDCEDVRIKRLLALATQKFVADIATDAFQYCKVRQSGNRKTGKDRKAVLTMEDLSQALAEYGVNVKKPDYYS
ncbi:transcription initiation factor TFIID 23-30kDa subunit-domain-containing protein [Circinella umbellata]|nr:transcription initiation factor TFIID 23-30kDa subunit-domain-containing protein [Circinella umbellata]